MKKQFQTEYYKNFNRYVLFLIVFSLLSICLLIYFGNKHNSDILGVWLPILFLIFPIVIGGRIKNTHKEKVLLFFTDLSFSCEFYSIKSNQITAKRVFLLADIEAYRFYFSPKLTTSLTLYFKNNKKETFIFFDNKTYEESIKGDSVFSNFFACVNHFNEFNCSEYPIRPVGGFMVTKAAGLMMAAETVIIIVALIIHIITHTFLKSYYLIIAVGLLLPQLINRMQNKKMYEQISKL